MKPRRMSANVAANVANAVASIGAAALSVPLILHFVGSDGFGVWTLAQTALVYVATAETGFGPALQRFVSVAHGARDPGGASRLVWTASVFYLALGVVVALATTLLAPAIVGLFDVEPALHDDAVAMFRLVGVAMLLALLVAGLANVQNGVERFTGAAAATILSAAVFLGLATVFLDVGRGLSGVAEAAVAQQAVGLLVRAWMVRDVLAAAPLRWVSRAQGRELLSFSLRMQVNVLSTLVNSQTDKIVVGLVATTFAIGEVGIGGQVAEATRFITGAALGPVLARLAIVQGAGSTDALAALYARLTFLWNRLTLGLMLIVCAVMQPLLVAWLGSGHDDAALYGVLLTYAYGVNMLMGPPLAYLRAVGRPGLEARYGLLVIGINVVLTIAGGLLFGPVGVVAATAVAYTLGTAWGLVRVRREIPAAPAAPGRPGVARTAAVGVAVAVAAGAWSELMAAELPRGVALLPIGAAGAAALVVFATAATGESLSAIGRAR